MKKPTCGTLDLALIGTQVSMSLNSCDSGYGDTTHLKYQFFELKGNPESEHEIRTELPTSSHFYTFSVAAGVTYKIKGLVKNEFDLTNSIINSFSVQKPTCTELAEPTKNGNKVTLKLNSCSTGITGVTSNMKKYTFYDSFNGAKNEIPNPSNLDSIEYTVSGEGVHTFTGKVTNVFDIESDEIGPKNFEAKKPTCQSIDISLNG